MPHRAKERALGWFRRLYHMLKKTGQTTCYVVGDDGDVEAGVPENYVVLDAGQYAGTSDIEVAHYAAATISFTAPNTIADAAGGLAGWAVNDRMVIKGSGSNDGEVTVTGIGGAPNNLTISAAVNEVAGAMISLYKVAAHSNNVVIDEVTRLMWSRYTTNGEAVGPNSNGTLNWRDAATDCVIYAGANTVACVATAAQTLFRIVGGAALTQFHEGDLIMAAGFANAVNNLPGYRILSVDVNGADLDLTIDPGRESLVTEGAVGDTISLVCQSIFNYAAGAALAGLAGYTETLASRGWRVPDDLELMDIRDMEAPNALPDPVAFPGWVVTGVWTTTTQPNIVANANVIYYSSGIGGAAVKTATWLAALVRGPL
jgi:hypothetical protein